MPHKDEILEFLHNNNDWKTLRMVRKEARYNMQVFITKWISGVLTTGKKMAIHKKMTAFKIPDMS